MTVTENNKYTTNVILQKIRETQGYVVGVGIALVGVASYHYEIPITNSLKTIFDYSVQPMMDMVGQCQLMNIFSICKLLAKISSLRLLLCKSLNIDDVEKIPKLLLLMKTWNCYYMMLGIGSILSVYYLREIITHMQAIFEFAKNYPFISLGIGMLGLQGTAGLETFFSVGVDFVCTGVVEIGGKRTISLREAIQITILAFSMNCFYASLIYLLLARNDVPGWSCIS